MALAVAGLDGGFVAVAVITDAAEHAHSADRGGEAVGSDGGHSSIVHSQRKNSNSELSRVQDSEAISCEQLPCDLSILGGWKSFDVELKG